MENRGDQLLGAVSIIVFLVLVGYWGASSTATLSETDSLKPIVPQSTLNFSPDLIVSTTTITFTFPHFESTTTDALPGTKKTVLVVTPKKTSKPSPPKTPALTTPSKPVPAATPEPSKPPEAFPGSTDFKKALVNILCTSRIDPVRGESASGVIIDSKGVILTAAHVGQLELLSQTLGTNAISCVVRTGDPARSTYKARLVYISESWLTKNPTTLISSRPLGTGEDDIALLALVETTNGSPLPASFPFVSLSASDVGIGESVYVGGYAAQYLTSQQVMNNLSPTFSNGIVDAFYTFRTSSLDVLSVLAGKAAQPGSSGGGAINKNGELVGIISTSETSGDFSTRHVRIITPKHIKESFESDTKQRLTSFLGTNSLSALLGAFESKNSELGTYLIHSIGLK